MKFKFWLILTASIILFSGCKTNQLYLPSKKISDQVLPHYWEYVKDDEELPEHRKKAIKLQIRTYQKLLEKYKEN